MAVNKTLEIDLTQLTQDSAKNLVSQFDDIIQKTTKVKKQKKKTKKKFGKFENRDIHSIIEKSGDSLLQTQEKQTRLKKLLDKTTFSNLAKVGSNPLGFIQGNVLKFIPAIGTALVATGVIAVALKKFDAFFKRFDADVDTRIDLFRDNETVKRIQAGLDQRIITLSPGQIEPRDAFNTFNEFETNQAELEKTYSLEDTSGVG